MRILALEKTGIKSGDIVTVKCRLKGKSQSMFVSIFASEHGSEFAPFIPALDKNIIGDEKFMHQPLFARLDMRNKFVSFTFLAYCDMDIRVIKEVDSAKDDARLGVKINVKRNKIVQALGRLYGKLRRIFYSLPVTWQ